MHKVTLLEETQRAGRMFPAGSYLCTDGTAGGFLMSAKRGKCLVEPWRQTDVWIQSKPVCVLRPGGIGDLLFVTPALKCLHDCGWKTAVCCMPQYFAVLEEMEARHGLKLLDYPLPFAAVPLYNIVSLEQVAETEQAKGTNVVDLIAGELKVALTKPESRELIYRPSLEMTAWARRTHPKTIHPRLGVQVSASAVSRTWPIPALFMVITSLLKKKWEIFLFDSPGNIRQVELPGLVNCSLRKYDLRQSAAVLETCDVCLAPDSAICHIAGAMRIPTVALYGPFPWQIRVKYAPTIFAIQGNAPCSPCHHHVRGGNEFPLHGPCFKTGKCEAMLDIAPDRVERKIEYLYENERGKK